MRVRSTIASRSSRRAGALLLAAALVGMLASGSLADPRAELDAAKDRLRELQGRVSSQQRELRTLHEGLVSVAGALEAEEGAYTDLVVLVVRAGDQLEAARATSLRARERLEERVRAVYMQGLAPGVGTVLGARSWTDLAVGMEYQDRVAEEDAALAETAGALARREARERTLLDGLLARQRSVLARLDGRRQRLTGAVAEHQAALERLAALRTELRGLVQRLASELRAEEASMARTAISGVPTDYREWATLLLERLGAPACRDNIVALVAWQTAEGTTASYNPLATTLPMPGATTFNSHGVKNYVSMEQGVRASLLTLYRGAERYGYGAILQSLHDCAPAMMTARAINQSRWCYGCVGGRYVLSLVPAVETYFERNL